MADLTYIQSASLCSLVGIDSTGTETNAVNADANGNLLVKDYSVGPVTAGAAASGSSLIGGQFNTSLPTLTNTQQAAIQVDSSGRILVGSIAGALPTGSNTIGIVNQGTAATLANAWSIKLTDGTNTMPTADVAARAMFVKQTDGTNVMPTGDVAARKIFVQATDGTNNTPAGDAVARSIFHEISDGTTGPVAVKAASTGPAAADKALVVVISPNQQAIPVTNAPASSTPAIAIGTVVTTSTALTAVRASTYNEQASNAQRSFSSSSVNDTSAGTGVRTITVTYYDSTGAGPSTETVTLNGTTAVNSVSTTICFVEKIVVATAGSGGVAAGTITMFVSTAGGGGTLATLNAGDDQTFWAHHYVATSKTCNITGLSGNNTSASNGSVLTLKAKTLNSANAVETQISDFVRVGGGTAQPVRVYNQLIKVTGPARIICYETCEGTPSITTRAAFDFYDA